MSEQSHAAQHGEQPPARKKGKALRIIAAVVLVAAAVVLGVFYVLQLGEIQLLGSSEIYVTAGDEYTDPGAICTYNGKDVTAEMVIQSAVKTMSLGEYYVDYYYRSPLGITYSAQRKVVVEDYKIPELLLLGSENMFIGLGADYTEPGYTANDNLDGELSDKVVSTGQVDSQTPGEYTINYSVTDSNGNTALATRTVTVSSYSPLTASVAEFTLDGYFTDSILSETPDAGEEYLLGTTYMGDSFTANYGYFGILPFRLIWCRESIHPFNVMTWTIKLFGVHKDITMVQAMAKYKPERVIILMGANCVAYCDPQEFADAYMDFVDALLEVSPDTKIIIMSVTPVLRSFDTASNSSRMINNSKINTCNYYLAQACSEKGVSFLNAAEVLKDANGAANPDYFYSSDGIHLNNTGNRVVMQYIRTHAIAGK